MQEYRAKKLDPFMRKFLGTVLIDRPENVVDYMLRLLTSLKGENERPSTDSHKQWRTDEETEDEEGEDEDLEGKSATCNGATGLALHVTCSSVLICSHSI